MTSPKTTINPQIIKEMESLLIEQKTRLEEDLEKFAKTMPKWETDVVKFIRKDRRSH